LSRRDGVRSGARAVDGVLWLLAIVMLGTLIVLSVGPQPPLPDVNLADKVLHAFAYAATIFVVLLAAVWRPGRGDGRFPKAGLILAGGLFMLGAGLELIQGLEMFAPRSAEPGDAIANAAGVLGGLGVWTMLETVRD